MSSSNSKIVLLNGSNYATWKIQCKMALIKNSLWGYVSGTEVEPEVDEAHAKYLANRNKALAIIVLAIDPSLLYLLGEPEDPMIVWQILQNQFQKKTWANKLSLRRKLYSLKLKEGEEIQQHIKSMTEIFNELAVVGDPVEEEDRVVYLLASLPDSFNMIVTALESNEEVPAMATVTERLLHEDRKLNDRADKHTETGLMTHDRKKGPKCFKCNKIGHIKRDCPMKVKRKPKPGKQKERVNKAAVDYSSDESVGLIVQHALKTSMISPEWIIDSGATTHMCNDKTLFTEMRRTEPVNITLGDGHAITSNSMGKIRLEVEASHGNEKVTLNDVLYVPGLAYNLISVSAASKTGKVAVFNITSCEIQTSDGKVVATGKRRGNLYVLNVVSSTGAGALLVSTSKEDLWHRRYGHLGENGLKKLAKDGLVDGFSFDASKKLNFCEPCVEGKIHRTKFPKASNNRSKETLGLIHSDVCGKISTKSLSGAEYFLTFIDDKTRYTWVYILKTKDQVFEKFCEWKSMVENQEDKKVKILRTDNGGEYTSGEFEKYLKKEGIRHELTIPKNPEQNGVAERMNRTLVEMTRSMLHDMPKKFWAEALSTAVYLRNRSPTTSVPDMTPYEALQGEKPDVSHLKQFGCICYAHIPKDERKKLDSKATKCIFLGYGDRVKGYRLYDETRGKVIHSRDVRFDETRAKESEIEICEPMESASDFESEHEIETGDNMDAENDNEANSDVEENADDDLVEEEPEQRLRRSQRKKNAPNWYGEWVSVATDLETPKSYREAIQLQNKDNWQTAMQKEIDSLHNNDVWDLVPLPEGRKVVGSKWVYKIKVAADGSIERYKARLVAQGFSQKYGQDYDETFCPVVRGESVRSVMALAAKNNLLLHQMDVATAFLNGHLEEEVYMKQPQGFEKQQDLVCKLKRSIYGLKQSPRCWNTALNEQLKNMGLIQSSADPCLYTAPGGEKVIVAVYVDDILIATETESKMKYVKTCLSRKFEVKDLGELTSFLGVQIKHDSNRIWIGQPGYVTRVLDKFGMTDAKPISTPVNVSSKLQTESASPTVDQSQYQSAVGCLLHLSNWTRPDITFAVNSAAKYTSNPNKEHWIAVKRIFRYLKGTANYGINYVKDSSDDIVGYCDADWAGDVNDRKSTSGYVFSLSGSPISWKSKKQTCVALSTAEAEYVALAAAAQESVWMANLLKDIDGENKHATVIYDDSQAAIAMSKNPQFHGRAKHIDIKYHYIREQVERGKIQLKYCPTANMHADILTKGLGKEIHEKLRKAMNIDSRD